MTPPPPRMSAPRWCIAAILLAAAALKAWGGVHADVGVTGPFVAAAVIGWEVLLAAWLLSGVMPAACWAAAAATFTAFAGVALRAALQGSPSCGCFGRVTVNPWFAFSLDLTVIALLIPLRPTSGDIRAQLAAVLGHAARPALVSLAFLLALGLIAGPAFGSWRAAAAWLRGEAVSFGGDVYDAGARRAGEIIRVRLTVHNWSDLAVRVYGGVNDCSCVVETTLPLELASGRAEEVTILLRLPGKAGVVRKTFHLLTDNERARRITCTVVCAVVPEG